MGCLMKWWSCSITHMREKWKNSHFSFVHPLRTLTRQIKGYFTNAQPPDCIHWSLNYQWSIFVHSTMKNDELNWFKQLWTKIAFIWNGGLMKFVIPNVARLANKLSLLYVHQITCWFVLTAGEVRWTTTFSTFPITQMLGICLCFLGSFVPIPGTCTGSVPPNITGYPGTSNVQEQHGCCWYS